MRRLFSVLALAAMLLAGAITPAFAAGHAGHATHTGNCGKSTSQTHKTLDGTRTKACPTKPHHPVTPSSNASGGNTAPGQHVRTTTPGWTKHVKHHK